MEFPVVQKVEKKRRFSFWPNFKGFSRKNRSERALAKEDITLLAANKFYNSFRHNVTENVLFEPAPTEKLINENYTTLENSELQNVHQDAGILFLTSGNQLRWKNPEDHQRHVQFAPTPLNKYHTYSNNPRKHPNIGSGKENFYPAHVKSLFPSALKHTGNEKNLGSLDHVTSFCEKQRLQDINVIAEDTIQMPFPRTSTKTVLRHEESILPYFNESSILQENRSSGNSSNFNNRRRSNQGPVDNVIVDGCFQEDVIKCTQASCSCPINKCSREMTSYVLKRNENTKKSGEIVHNLIKMPIESSHVKNCPSFGSKEQRSDNEFKFQECVNSVSCMEYPKHCHSEEIPYFTVYNPEKSKSLPPNVGIIPYQRHSFHQEIIPATEYKLLPENIQRINKQSFHQSECIQLNKISTSGSRPIIHKQTKDSHKYCLMIPPFVSMPKSGQVISPQPIASAFRDNANSCDGRSYDSAFASNLKRTNFVPTNAKTSGNMPKYQKPEKGFKSSSPKLGTTKNFRPRKSKYDGISSLADDECSLNCSCGNCMLGLTRSKEVRRSWRRDRSKTKLFFPNQSQSTSTCGPQFIPSNHGLCSLPETVEEWYKCDDLMCKSPACKKAVVDTQEKVIDTENIYANGDVMITDDYEIAKNEKFQISKLILSEKDTQAILQENTMKSDQKVENILPISETLQASIIETLSDGVELTPRSKKLSQSCLSALQTTLMNVLQEYKNQPEPSFSISSYNSENESRDKLNTIVIKIQNDNNDEQDVGCNETSIPTFSKTSHNIIKDIEENERKVNGLSFVHSQSLPELVGDATEQHKETPMKAFHSTVTLSPTTRDSLQSHNITAQLKSLSNKDSANSEELVECSDELPSGWDKSPSAEDTNSGYSTCSLISSSKNSEVSLSSKELEMVQEMIRTGMRVTASGAKKKNLMSPSFGTKKKKFKAKEVLSGKAKLKLSIYHNSGLVTIHIMKAVKLTSVRTLQLNPYVKVSLYPDDTRRAHWRSKVINGQNSPVFDQKFSFEIVPEDSKKRLIFSLWHRDFEKKRSEFLGCMSFGVHHVMDSTQHLNGWYRLLKEVVGTKKHFAARHGSGNAFTKFLGG